MITLERTHKERFTLQGENVDVTFRVPTAEDVENVFRNKEVKDTDVFKTFVIEVVSEGIEGWEGGLKPEDVTAMPGTYSIVNKVALAVTKTAFLSEEEKK